MTAVPETDSPIALLTERKLVICVYASNKANTPKKAGTVTWAWLKKLLHTRALRAEKSGAAFSLYRLHEGGTRRNIDVRELSGFVGDVDAGTTLDDLRGKLAGLTWCAYSSHSHNPEVGNIKFRVVLPFTRSVSASEWPEVWAGADAMFGGVLDGNCKDLAHMYYLPSCPVEMELHAFFESAEAEYLDPARLISLARQGQSQHKAPNNTALTGGLMNDYPPMPETPENVAKVRAMLAAVPADCDRETWRNICWAVQSLGWACGVELAREWSMTA